MICVRSDTRFTEMLHKGNCSVLGKEEHIKMKQDHITGQKKKEQEEIKFFRSFLLFLIHSFDCLFTHQSRSVKVRNQMERNLLTSISLMWNMHVSTLLKKTLYSQIVYSFPIQSTFDKDQSKELLSLFQRLKKEVEKYPFLNKNYKNQCENMLEQILQYYLLNSDSVLFIVDPDLPRPWISKP